MHISFCIEDYFMTFYKNHKNVQIMLQIGIVNLLPEIVITVMCLLGSGRTRARDDELGEHWQQSYRATDRVLVLLAPDLLLFAGPGTYTNSDRVDTGPAADDSDTTWWSAEQSVVSLECLHDTSRRSRSHGSTYLRC